jgi:hypothetical protein
MRLRDTLENMSDWLLLCLRRCKTATDEGKIYDKFLIEMAKLEELGLTTKTGNGFQVNEAGTKYLELKDATLAT